MTLGSETGATPATHNLPHYSPSHNAGLIPERELRCRAARLHRIQMTFLRISYENLKSRCAALREFSKSAQRGS